MTIMPRVRAVAMAGLLTGAATVAADQQAPLPAPPPAPVVVPEYVVQRGDELSIKVLGHPELDDTVTVRPDGRISAPVVDDVEAAGLTTRALDAALTVRLGKLYADPDVTVVVRRMASLRVFVGGEVGQPGVIAISADLTALGAIYQAGGFRSTARTDSVVLLRDSKGDKPLTMKLDLKQLDKGQALMPLQAHDVVFVPMSRIAKIDRFVDQYARQLLPISLTAGFSYVIGDFYTVR